MFLDNNKEQQEKLFNCLSNKQIKK